MARPRPERLCPRPNAAGDPHGFTLVELVVVLFVLGVALAVVAPTLPTPPAEANAAAEELVRVLERARRTAAERGRTVNVALDLRTGAYRVRMQGRERELDSVLASGKVSLAETPRSADAHGSRWRTFRFGALGRAEGEPVRLQDRTGRSVTVYVDAWTGRAHAGAMD